MEKITLCLLSGIFGAALSAGVSIYMNEKNYKINNCIQAFSSFEQLSEINLKRESEKYLDNENLNKGRNLISKIKMCPAPGLDVYANIALKSIQCDTTSIYCGDTDSDGVGDGGSFSGAEKSNNAERYGKAIHEIRIILTEYLSTFKT